METTPLNRWASLTDISPKRKTAMSIWKRFLTAEPGKCKLIQTPLDTFQHGRDPEGWQQQMSKDVEEKRPPSPHPLLLGHRTGSCIGRVWQFLTQLNIPLSINLTVDFWSLPKGKWEDCDISNMHVTKGKKPVRKGYILYGSNSDFLERARGWRQKMNRLDTEGIHGQWICCQSAGLGFKY